MVNDKQEKFNELFRGYQNTIAKNPPEDTHTRRYYFEGLLAICVKMTFFDEEEAWKRGIVATGIDAREELRNLRYDFRHSPLKNYEQGWLCYVYGKLAGDTSYVGIGKRAITGTLADFNPSIFPEDKKWFIKFMYSHAADIFRHVYNEEKKLEELVNSIICREIAEHHGHKEPYGYHQTGIEYYELFSRLAKESAENPTSTIQNALNELNYFRIGRLPRMLQVCKSDKGERGHKLKRTALAYALSNFREALRRDFPQRYCDSYIGNCLRHHLNLEKLSIEPDEELRALKTAKTLRISKIAEKHFSSAVEGKMKNHEDCAADYSTLAEVQFKIADFAASADEVVEYLKKAAGNFGNAIANRTTPRREDYSFLGASLAKLARRTDDPHKRKELLVKSARSLLIAMRHGDESPEVRSKLGEVCLTALQNELENDGEARSIEVSYRLAKKYLEEAAQRGHFTYPMFLLANLSDTVSEYNLPFKDIQPPEAYIEEALRKYTQEKDRWACQRIPGTLNEVLVPCDEYGLLGRVLLLKKGKKEYLEQEKENVDELNRTLNRAADSRLLAKFKVPKPFSIITLPGVEGKYYAMAKAGGKELGEFLRGKNTEETIPVLNDVTEFLAFIHSALKPQEIHRPFETVSFVRRKLEKVLQSGSPLINKLLENGSYTPIDYDVSNTDPLFVFNKDAHPRNWIVEETRKGRRITAIDFEAKTTLVPTELDLVRLFEPCHLVLEQRERLLRRYITHMEKHRDEADAKKVSMRRYLNLSVPQAIAFLTWPQLPLDEKLALLQDARKNLEMVREVDLQYYQTFEKEYKNVQECLSSLEEILEHNQEVIVHHNNIL